MGVREVWFWRDDRIEVHALGGDGYARVEKSGLLPELDLAELERYVRMPDQADAARAYFEALQNGT